MHKAQAVTKDEVIKISKLSNLRLQDHQTALFADQFTKTIEVVNQLNEIDTNDVKGTYQVNNLHNIGREDVVDLKRVLPLEVALREAKLTHNGFFVVPRVIDSEETL